ncbi:hypothetical protein CCHR01_17560 [Colletotrichum chrysophilum]|uniref:Uncharacterized protein n=1 Tax=Colletotrichum chrysophilum TaxID=1836956 RepID=A0AAD9A465_9PEZI|nr:hypothetical protein CCHR01_17560 [Colletotrichum chrysophilum]
MVHDVCPPFTDPDRDWWWLRKHPLDDNAFAFDRRVTGDAGASTETTTVIANTTSESQLSDQPQPSGAPFCKESNDSDQQQRKGTEPQHDGQHQRVSGIRGQLRDIRISDGSPSPAREAEAEHMIT